MPEEAEEAEISEENHKDKKEGDEINSLDTAQNKISNSTKIQKQ